MKVIDQLECLEQGIPSVVTVGVFDGVHIGHQTIMRIVTTDAASRHMRSVAVTFDRNPVEIVNPSSRTPYITTLDQKLRLIADQGLDLTLVLRLHGDVLKMAAEEFAADVLCRQLGAREMVVGTDFAFGKGRTGNVNLLRKMGDSLGYETKVVSPVMIGDITVSSTVIRRLIIAGEVEEAKELLDHPFTLQGTVVEGKQIGRTIGFPTANIRPASGQVLPANGVYAVSVMVDGREWPGVANIGNRPTVGGLGVTVEVHIIGFSDDLYGQEFGVEFHHRLRDEVRFNSVDELKRQIGLDAEQALRLIGI